MIDKIYDFVENIKASFLVNMHIDYNKEEDFYYIWHDNEELASSDKFNEFIGMTMNDMFWNDGIYNVAVSYDPVIVEKFKYNDNSFTLNHFINNKYSFVNEFFADSIKFTNRNFAEIYNVIKSEYKIVEDIVYTGINSDKLSYSKYEFVNNIDNNCTEGVLAA